MDSDSEFVSCFSFSYQSPEPTESMTSLPCMEIMRSSRVLLQIPHRTSWSNFIFLHPSPPFNSSPGWEPPERWSDINLLLSLTSTVAWWIIKVMQTRWNCFVQVLYPLESVGCSVRWMGGDADRRCVFGATSNLSAWMIITLRGLVLIPRESG